ncbi:uncharacterized protein A4U43_C03F31770 [Asparagus officinalis]|uniref:Uncharacterized protein n=1 Tax=Asparagus officinalis TaxID=4686 RepID=A0A5P1FEG6_ASPOF|nr:uncharacterized protein A4U43_C03F31770 [Asparagus officinalis]
MYNEIPPPVLQPLLLFSCLFLPSPRLPNRQASTSPPPRPRTRRPLRAAPDRLSPDPTTGVFLPRPAEGSIVLWDLDNKPPARPPYAARPSPSPRASSFGRGLTHISAYANRHAFTHLTRLVPSSSAATAAQPRRPSAQGPVLPSGPLLSYVCSVCGRKCPPT